MSSPMARRIASLATAALITALALPAASPCAAAAPLAPASPPATAPAAGGATAPVGSPLLRDLHDELAQHVVAGSAEQVRVIVTLKDQPASPSQAQESANLSAQDALIASWTDRHRITVDNQFGYLLNAFSAQMPASSIPALAAEPEVASVRRERVYSPAEHTARDHHGVPAAYGSHDVDGTGTVIAIIDSGIDPSHPDLRLDDCGSAKIQSISPEGGLFTCKVPSGYNYADESFEVRDLTSSQHGQHVAGIAAANGSQGAASEFATTGRIDGAAPNAQLLAMKVFSNNPETSRGANDADIIAAVEDSVKMGADVINMSLGSPNGLTDTSDGAYQAIAKARQAGVLTVVAAGNDGQNFSSDGTNGDVLGRLDDGTVGTPAVQGQALSVASIDNSSLTAPQGHLGQGASRTSFTYQLATGMVDDAQHRLVDKGLGRQADYTDGEDLAGAYVLVERGEISFAQKYANAIGHGASGILVLNSAEGGEARMAMGGVAQFDIVGASLTRSEGLALRQALAGDPGLTVRLTREPQVLDNPSALTPSSFSSWGTTPGLDFAPQISGIGGSVYSTIGPDSYASDSGTSMAAPNIAGLSALLVQDLARSRPELGAAERLELATALLMNTATIPTDASGTPYPPRQVGAGLAQVDRALASPVTATADGSAALALRQIEGPTTFTVTLTNHSGADASYTLPAQQVLTETSTAGQPTTAVVSSEALTASTESVTVPAHGTAEVSLTLTPETATNHFIEGWVRLEPMGAHPALNLPYLGFVGDWNAESILQQPGQKWSQDAPGDTTGLLGASPQGPMPMSFQGEPLAFSPNNDGNLDTVLPNLLLMRNAGEITYEVLDADGASVADLGREENIARYTGKDVLGSRTSGLVSHTGRSFDGRVWDPAQGAAVTIPEGSYTYRVSARLGQDFPWQVTDLPVQVDTTAPAVTVLERGEGSVRFSATDTGAGLLMEPRVYTADERRVEVTALEDGTFRASFTGTTPFLSIEAIDRGMSVTSERVFYGEPSLFVTVDGRVVSDQILVGAQTLTLTVEGFASGGASRVTVNGQEAGLEGYQFSTELPFEASVRELEVRSYGDDGALLAETSIPVVHDGEPPVITVTGGDVVDGQVVLSQDGTATISGTVTDDRVRAPALSASVNGTDLVLDDTGAFTTTVQDTGASQVHISASDGVNHADRALAIQGRQDQSEAEGPALTNQACGTGRACFIRSGDPDLSQDGATFTARGQTGGPDGGSIEFTGGARAQDGAITAHDPIAAQIGPDGGFTAPLPVTTGLNDYRMVARDAQGRVVREYVYHLYLDTHPPTLTVTEPGLIGGSLYTSEDEVAFRGSISDDGWGYYLALNNATAAELIRLNNPGAGVNAAPFEQVVAVRDGDLIRVHSTDSVGNALVGLIPVVVDKTAPSTGVEPVESGQTIRDGRPLSAWAQDDHLATMRVRLNGELISEASTSLTSQEVQVQDTMLPSGPGDPGPALGSGSQEHATGADDATGADRPDEAGAGQSPDQGGGAGEVVAFGSRTGNVETRLEATIQTADLAAGHYTLSVESTDLAGNTATETRSVVVDDEAVIEGPDSAEIRVAPGGLAKQDEAAAAVLAQYSVIDDGSAHAQGGTSLSLAPGTVLVEGVNTVGLVALDASQRMVTRTVTITVRVAASGGQAAGGPNGAGGPGGPAGDSSSGTGVPQRPAQPGERPTGGQPAGAVTDERSRWTAIPPDAAYTKAVPSQSSQPSQSSLPSTGARVGGPAVVGLLVLAAGGAVIALRRRRG